MLAVERRKRIVDFLNEYRHANVSTLSSMLSVAEVTIRKDLEMLEDEGVLQRTHGGAVLKEAPVRNPAGVTYQDQFTEEKKKIAYIAARCIPDGAVIFLSHGSVCQHIARMIKEKHNLTVVTNNLLVMSELHNCSDIDLIALGGNVLSNGDNIGMFGADTAGAIKNLFFDISFLSVDAIHRDYGYMVAKKEYAEVIRAAMGASAEKYIVADSSRFDKRSMLKLCDFEAIDKVITDENIADEFKELCFTGNKQLLTTINFEP